MFLELLHFYNLKQMSLSAELFLSCSILQFTFFAISTVYNQKTGFIILKAQFYYICTLLLILSAYLILNEDLLILNSFTNNNFVTNDYFSFASKFCVCLISILFLLIINILFENKINQYNFEYSVLITISILGLLLLCSANDLITAYLALELHSISFYIMAAFKKNSNYSIEAGLKYFIIGALSSAFFLFGTAVIYGFMGSVNLNDLQLFFVLLVLDSQSYIFFVTETINNNNLQSELTFANYDSVYNQSLFGFICRYFINFLSIKNTVINFNFNLIDWYTTNHFEKNLNFFFVSTIPISLININKWFSVSINISSYWVLSQLIIEFLFVKYQFLKNFLIFDILNKKLEFVDYIFIAYTNIQTINNLNQLAVMSNFDLISIGFILVCISLFIKLSVVPFHFWSIDVYEGSPNLTTFFFSIIPKISLFVLLMRFCLSFYQIFINNFQAYFFLFAILSVLLGSVGGLEQRKLKTLLAYSSISHTGYLLLSFCTGNLEGLEMLFYYLIIYILSGLIFWSIYLFLYQKKILYKNKLNKELGDLILLNKSNPILALILATTLFSIAGIPPVVGFLAKIGIFLVLIKSYAYLFAVLSIVFSVISTFYYIRLIKILYFENTLIGQLYTPINSKITIVISVLAILLIITCIDPMLVYLLFCKAILLT